MHGCLRNPITPPSLHLLLLHSCRSDPNDTMGFAGADAPAVKLDAEAAGQPVQVCVEGITHRGRACAHVWEDCKRAHLYVFTPCRAAGGSSCFAVLTTSAVVSNHPMVAVRCCPRVYMLTMCCAVLCCAAPWAGADAVSERGQDGTRSSPESCRAGGRSCSSSSSSKGSRTAAAAAAATGGTFGRCRACTRAKAGQVGTQTQPGQFLQQQQQQQQ